MRGKLVSYRTGAGRRFPRVVVAGLLVLGAAANGAAVRQVWCCNGSLILDNFTTNFRVELDQQGQ